MFNNILVATDGSNHAEKALSIAVNLASKYDSKLIILHVLMHGDVPAGFRRMAEVEDIDAINKTGVAAIYNIPANLAATLKSVQPDLNEEQYFDFLAKNVIDDSKRKAQAGGAKNVVATIVSGDTAQKILDTARDEQVDLIVLGTRGLSEVKRLLIGSVASKVTQLSNCPCLSVK